MNGNKTYKQLYLNNCYKIRKNKLLQPNQKELNDLDINVFCKFKAYFLSSNGLLKRLKY